MDAAEIKSLVTDAVREARSGPQSPWDIDRIIEVIKTLGFPLVMCVLMSWGFYAVGRLVFMEFIEANRKNVIAVEAAMKERKEDDRANREVLVEIKRHLEKHTEALSQLLRH